MRQVGWVAGLELDGAVGAGMLEGEPDACSHWRSAQPGGEHRVGAVGEVADARVAQGAHVHPDLVGAPGLQLDLQQVAERWASSVS